MNKTSQLLAIASVAAAVLAAPGYAQTATEHDHNHDAASSTAPAGKAKPATKSASASAKKKSASPQGDMMMDKKAMCDMHKQMMGKSDAERQAMMDEKMPGMSGDKKQQQMHMMDEQCK